MQMSYLLIFLGEKTSDQEAKITLSFMLLPQEAEIFHPDAVPGP